jgi:hypothetical protein
MEDLLPDFGSLVRGRIRYLPVAPGRLEFAIEVRKAILSERPQVVAVELPATLEAAYLKAVARLPEITVIVYPEDKVRARSLRSGGTGGSLHGGRAHGARDRL